MRSVHAGVLQYHCQPARRPCVLPCRIFGISSTTYLLRYPGTSVQTCAAELKTLRIPRQPAAPLAPPIWRRCALAQSCGFVADDNELDLAI